MIIKLGRKKFDISYVKKVSELGKIRGLMFRRREIAKSLLFEFKKPTNMKIHSFFVFFPFVAVWMDKDNNILEIKTVKSWKISVYPSVKYSKLLEIPLNNFYSPRVKNLVEQKI